MKRLYFKALWLTSFREKKSRKIVFDQKKTLIKGKNDTGKSCLLKSIYHSMGADVSFEKTWSNAEVKSVMEFEVDGESYFFLRDGSLFGLYNANKEIIQRFSSVTNELAPTFSELFDFHLTLSTPKGDEQLATPAFLFLPYYIDQDNGWLQSFNSFQKLAQFSRWRKAVIEYHSGIKPKEYYEKRIIRNRLAMSLAELKPEFTFLGEMLEKQQNKFRDIDFNIDVKEFKKDIERLVDEANELKKIENKYKNEVVKNSELKVFVQNQLEIVNKNVGSSKKTLKQVDEHHGDLECPLCSTEFEQVYEERLEIAVDLGDLTAYQSELNQQVIEIDTSINNGYKKLKLLEDRSKKIFEILATKKNKISLRDLMLSEGKKDFINEMKKDFDTKKSSIDKFKDKVKAVDKELRAFTDKKRVDQISSEYFSEMKRGVHELSVQNMSESAYSSITAKAQKSGSDHPRALLSYFFSFLYVNKRYTTSTVCPLVIDSPNQQDQDEENIEKMMNYIVSNSETEDQLIIGSVSNYGIDFPGKVIELVNENELLKSEEFEEGALLFSSLFDQIIS